MYAFIKKTINGFEQPYAALSRYDYISFDIFDTLIIRRCGDPEKVFDIVEEKYNGESKTKLSCFRKHRKESELLARQKTSKNEIQLEDIYNEMVDYPDSIRNRLMLLEIEVEKEVCVRNEKIADAYNKLVEMGKTVFITSDMYLPYTVITEIVNNNSILPPKNLYLSSRSNATKREGNLFRVLLEENNIESKKLIHIGDNVFSDVLIPRKLGIKSYWL